VVEQLLARPCRFAAPALLAALQHLSYRFAHRLHGLLQTRPRQLAFAELMPQVKQRVALFQQACPNCFAWLATINHRLEIATQMRPTPLQALDPPIRLQPVAGGHSGVILAQ
jgi:hypothetical protein